MAVTSSGDVLVNAYQLSTADDFESVIETALATGRPIFIGVALDREEQADVMRDVDDGCADIVGRLGGRMQARRRSSPR